MVKEIGGLHVIGTERHDARRIDLQLRGRCGRQGDPGSSRFFLSLEDDLMRIFAGPWVKSILERLGMKEGERIESRMVTRRIEAAQKKVEERNFEIRKNLLEYDEVMDEQRKRVYRYRQQILDGVNCRDLIIEMIREQVDYLRRHLPGSRLRRRVVRQMGRQPAVDHAGCPRFSRHGFRVGRYLCQGTSRTDGRNAGARRRSKKTCPMEEDPSEWNWEALAKFANTRWGLNLRDRDLKKVGRDDVAELLIEKAREAIRSRRSVRRRSISRRRFRAPHAPSAG